MSVTTFPSPVLVTGAGGCVGRQVVDLLLSRGVSVRAVDRPGVPGLPELDGLEWVEADLVRRESLPALVRGVQAIVHTAAIVDIALDFDALAPVNWFAVQHLYRAAERAGVNRFVHFSTGSLYAPRDDGEPWKEVDPLWSQNDYGRTKLLAEDFLRARCGSGPRVAITRPGLIIGPAGKALLASLAPAGDMLGALPLSVRLRGGPRTNIIHARDAARAAVFLLEADHEDGEIFNLANEDVVDIGEIMDVVTDLAGRPRREIDVRFPALAIRRLVPLLDRPFLFDVLRGVMDLLWRGFRRRHGALKPHLALRIDREAIPFVASSAIFDVSKLAGLGFQWEFPTFRASWKDAVDWYRAHGWLPVKHVAQNAIGGSS